MSFFFFLPGEGGGNKSFWQSVNGGGTTYGTTVRWNLDIRVISTYLPSDVFLKDTILCFYSNHQRWHEKWKLSRNMCTIHTRFCHVSRRFACSVGAYQQDFCIGTQEEVYQGSVVGWVGTEKKRVFADQPVLRSTYMYVGVLLYHVLSVVVSGR